MSTPILQEFVDTISQRKLPVYGIKVMRGQEEIGKHFFASDQRYPIYSATKSVVSMAIGMAKEEYEFSLTDSILQYLEEDLPKDCTNQKKDMLEPITLERLLTMSVTGYPFRPEGEDWLAYSLLVDLKNTTKPVFDYSNIPAYLMGVILEKIVKDSLMSYLKPRLFDPLGIVDPTYQKCPSNHFYGASGMELNLDELGKLGQLYLQNGIWKQKQIILKDWILQSTQKRMDSKEGGYGYFFWCGDHEAYRISGKWGQRSCVFPQKDLCVTYLANMQLPGSSDWLREFVETSIVDKL